jgi:hypothetical protein
MKSECIGCRARDQLESLGKARTAAIWHCHAISCHPNDHKLCSECATVSIPALMLPSNEQPIKRRLLLGLLDCFHSLSPAQAAGLSDRDLLALTGLDHSQLNEIAEASGCAWDQVFQLFVLCRLGLAQRPLAALVGKHQGTISKQFRSVIRAAEGVMAAKYLQRSRDEILSNVPELIRALYPALVAAVDGTYHEVQKSKRFLEQLKSYSDQKKYNLLKTLSLLTVDGRWWDLLGLFYSDGDHNDEMLWEYTWRTNPRNFKRIINEEDDQFLVDRFSSCSLLSS